MDGDTRDVLNKGVYLTKTVDQTRTNFWTNIVVFCILFFRLWNPLGRNLVQWRILQQERFPRILAQGLIKVCLKMKIEQPRDRVSTVWLCMEYNGPLRIPPYFVSQ